MPNIIEHELVKIVNNIIISNQWFG